MNKPCGLPLQANATIAHMIEERKLTIQERDTLKRELVIPKSHYFDIIFNQRETQ